MSHLTCTNCLEKSPADATRCKHCGRSFGPPPPGATGSMRGLISAALVLAGMAVVVAGVYWWWPSLRVAPPVAPPEATAAQAPVPPVPRESRAVPAEKAGTTPVESVRTAPAQRVRTAQADSVPPVPRPAARPPRDSLPAPAAAAADTARPVAPAAAVEPVSFDPAHQRYARVFANLRAEPTGTATVLKVLRPGEVVTVDSLLEGWYRVLTAEQVVGYVDRQYLDTLPPGSP